MRTRALILVVTATCLLAACAKKEDQEATSTADSSAAQPATTSAPADSAPASGDTLLPPGPWHWVGTLSPVEWIAPANPADYTLEFGPGGSVAAKIDCNRGNGGYRIDGKTIRFGPLATTKMMCPPGSLDVKFAQQIDAARHWFMHGDTLMMDLMADSGTMRFVR
jgi:para-nitrobenzyl esterase